MSLDDEELFFIIINYLHLIQVPSAFVFFYEFVKLIDRSESATVDVDEELEAAPGDMAVGDR